MGTLTSLAEYTESADRATLRRRMWRCSQRIKEYEAKGDDKGVHRNVARHAALSKQMKALTDFEDAPHAS